MERPSALSGSLGTLLTIRRVMQHAADAQVDKEAFNDGPFTRKKRKTSDEGMERASQSASQSASSSSVSTSDKDKSKDKSVNDIRPPRLLLHFDINKTILMSDVGAGVSNEDMLNSLLSECVFGYIREGTTKESRTAHDWILISETPTTEAPESAKELVTFGDYLENHIALAKAERVPFKRNFTSCGGVGERFKTSLEELSRRMSLPEAVTSAAKHKNFPWLSDGSYHIIPAFFSLIIELDRRKWDFRIIFRTFGSDTDRIASEFNSFCDGFHPCYPGVKMNGEESTVDRRLVLPTYSGMLRRISDDRNGVLFASVTNQQVSSRSFYDLQ
jgi:hypothetical protein